jgi:hypothetical protein
MNVLVKASVLGALIFFLFPQTAQAQSNRRPDKYIDALFAAPRLVTYSHDGAADNTVTAAGEPIPEVRAIVNLGRRAIPLLIAHLDDTRPTSARFGRDNLSVPVGHVCLDILTNIIRARRILVEDCADDGLGACVRDGYYFRPDAYARRGGGLVARPEVSRVKRNWQRAYRRGYIRFRYPEWWRQHGT